MVTFYPEPLPTGWLQGTPEERKRAGETLDRNSGMLELYARYRQTEGSDLQSDIPDTKQDNVSEDICHQERWS